MSPGTTGRWACDGEFFGSDDALAGHLAVRVDSGDQTVSFSRDGCWFRLSSADDADPAATAAPVVGQRTYTVELVTNSPHCARGNVFTAAWPEGYTYGPVRSAAPGTPAGAGSPESTPRHLARVLGDIGSVLWP